MRFGGLEESSCYTVTVDVEQDCCSVDSVTTECCTDSFSPTPAPTQCCPEYLVDDDVAVWDFAWSGAGTFGAVTWTAPGGNYGPGVDACGLSYNVLCYEDCECADDHDWKTQWVFPVAWERDLYNTEIQLENLKQCVTYTCHVEATSPDGVCKTDPAVWSFTTDCTTNTPTGAPTASPTEACPEAIEFVTTEEDFQELTSITIEWTPSSNFADRYEVVYKSEDDLFYPIDILDATSTSITITGLSEETCYEFGVQPIKDYLDTDNAPHCENLCATFCTQTPAPTAFPTVYCPEKPQPECLEIPSSNADAANVKVYSFIR